MTIATTPAYSVENAKLERSPACMVQFAGNPSMFSTHFLCDYLTEILTDKPAAYWRFGEPGGSAADDSSGNGLSGTYENSPTLGVSGAIQGSSNTAVTLNGTSQSIQVPDNALLHLGDTFTFECWVRLAGSGTYILFDKDANSAEITVGPNLALSQNNVGSICISTVTVPLSAWTHCVVTKSGSAVHLYVNGVDVTSSITNRTIANTSSALGIGAASGNIASFLAGSLDECAIYPSALSAQRVVAHYSAGLCLQKLSGVIACMEMPNSVGPQIKPREGSSTIGTTTLTINDDDGAVTTLIGQGIGGKSVSFYTGFTNLQLDEFTEIPSGVVSGFKMTPGLVSYEIDIQDPQTLINKKICDPAVTSLTAVLAASATDTFVHYLNVLGSLYTATNNLSAAAFSTILDTVYGSGNWSFTATSVGLIGTTIDVVDTSLLDADSGYVKIENEIIAYTGRTATTLTGLTRGALGTVIGLHIIGVNVAEMFRLGPDLPMNLVQGIYENTGKSGCAVPPSSVDSTHFSAIQTTLGTCQMDLRVAAQINAKDLLEQEFFKVLGCYPRTTGAGLLSGVIFAKPLSSDIVAALDHDSIVADKNGTPVMTWDGGFDQIINQVTIQYDSDPVTSSFNSSFVDSRPLSIALYGSFPLIIQSNGLRSELTGTAALLKAITTSILDRFENGAPSITLRTHLRKNLIEAGDIVTLDSSLLPNRYTKTRGITGAMFEVINRTINFDSGTVDFQLMWTSWGISAEDDFNRADTSWDSQPDLGSSGAWSSNSACVNGIEVHSNQLRIGNFGAGLGGYGFLFQTSTIGANQFSEFQFVSQTSGISGPAVRQGSGGGFGSYTGYVAAYDHANSKIELRKYLNVNLDGTTHTLLTTAYSGTLTAGDTLRIHAQGAILTVFLNDAQILMATDADIVGGSPGGMMDKATGGVIWDSWKGGDDGWA